ncbi:MAG TPA: hypothetical protein VI391_06365 [Thermoanaerobaculia bacterium]
MASNAWWPDVSTLDEARKAARQGMWGAIFVAVVTAIVALAADKLGVQASFVDAAIFAVLAGGIAMNSRIAAVATLLLYIAETVYRFTVMGPKGLPLTVVLMLAFINSVRGTFAYHSSGTIAPSKTPPMRAPVRVQPASRSAMATIAIAIAIVVAGIGGWFALQLKFQREAKGTAQLGTLPPIKTPDAPPVEQAIMMPQPKTAAQLAQPPQTDTAAEARKKQDEDARLAAEPQIYLEAEWKMYHVAGCKAVTAAMRPTPIEKRPFDYQPHTCVPDDLRRWTRKLRD